MENNIKESAIDNKLCNSCYPIPTEYSCGDTTSSLESVSSDLEYNDQNYNQNSNAITKKQTTKEKRTIFKNGEIQNLNDSRHLFITVRNARERYRVFQINEAFTRLRQVIPYTAYRKKRISKVKTLTKALQYISELEEVLGISNKTVK